ncbi:hypothetical protein [Ideonella livida]|uniref:Uncharacterized protein n=1 Tax=Ideonella livida TaxID=2707176 RepID=A0A7C9PGK7_9BURK|nr:hypothetical protein [Ideonella livida]NDY90991.1 hypothetical protein [Ideonella livida]
MPNRFVKTSAGQQEIQARARALSRPLRNLLLVINDSQPVEYWLDSVRGLSEGDLDLLVAEGLIAPVVDPRVAKAVPASPGTTRVETVSPDSDWTELLQAVEAAPYVPLYDVLTSQGKAHLGLMKGYRFVLEVEKCNGPEALRALARSFVTQLRDEAGMNAVRGFAEALRKA